MQSFLFFLSHHKPRDTLTNLLAYSLCPQLLSIIKLLSVSDKQDLRYSVSFVSFKKP